MVAGMVYSHYTIYSLTLCVDIGKSLRYPPAAFAGSGSPLSDPSQWAFTTPIICWAAQSRPCQTTG